MPGISVTQLIIILAILLLLFGAKRLPDIARSIGTSVRELKSGLSGTDQDEGEADQDEGEAVDGSTSEDRDRA